MQICFTGSAQPVICCETVRRQKQNCTKSYSPLFASGCSRLLASDRKCGTLQFLGLQAHSVMKNRASYTLEIVKIFFFHFLSFWLSFYLSFFHLCFHSFFFNHFIFHFFIIFLTFYFSLFFHFFHFFHFLLHFFHFFIMFHHFCFQWCKNFPKNKKLQFSSSFFHFFIIFLSFFYHVSSFLLPVVQKFSEK